MSIFGNQADKVVKAMENEIIKAKEFEGGLTLQFQSVDKVKGQYGATEDSAIVERGILEEGQQFIYTFKDAEKILRKHYSTSFPLFIAMQKEEINEGDWLFIKRVGSGKETNYVVNKVDAPIEEDISPEDIPFD